MLRKCICPGHWTEKIKHYRWLKKNEKTCKIKCMICNARWYSQANYIRQLDQHIPRRRGRLSYEKIIELIKEDRFKINTDEAIIYSLQKGGKYLPLRQRVATNRSLNRGGKPRLYVELQHCNTRREISVSRLVWMAEHLVPVPAGYDPDHIDKNPMNNSISNLRLLDSKTNQSNNFTEEDLEYVPF